MIHTTQEWRIGDCLELLPEIETGSIDMILTDPPYGYSFMGKDWDKAVPSVDIWQACLRVLKPGAFAFIMSAPRQDVLAHNLVNLSDAGFDTGFTSIYHAYASGFPKAGNIGKMVDKRLGVEREVIGKSQHSSNRKSNLGYGNELSDEGERYVTAPATSEAKALDGSYTGFQPKPAVEVIMVVMKPLSERTYMEQAMANQHGITWLDDGRIPIAADDRHEYGVNGDEGKPCINTYGEYERVAYQQNPQGRFPANLLVSDDVLNDGVFRHKAGNVRVSDMGDYNASSYKAGDYPHNPNYYSDDSGDSFSRYFDLDAWFDTKYLPKEAQKTFPFMIVPKASKSEKGANNKHPTVKPVKLFSWLMTLGSREGDLVLDPFLGSGVALAAGRLTNRGVIGFEISDEWEPLYPNRCMTHTPPLTSYFGAE